MPSAGLNGDTLINPTAVAAASYWSCSLENNQEWKRKSNHRALKSRFLILRPFVEKNRLLYYVNIVVSTMSHCSLLRPLSATKELIVNLD